ncbi:MAG: DUF4252 domain-containing protein [Rubricoccaceae bacterium]
MNRFLLVATLALVLPLAAPVAQTPLSASQVDALFSEEPRIEVNLSGSLLRLAAAAARREEPATAAVIENLRGVTVRVYDRRYARADLTDSLAGFGQTFEASGWTTLARVRERSTATDRTQDVWIYVLDQQDAFGGLALMVDNSADDEVVFVLIDGTIDPADVGALTERFGGVDARGNRSRRAQPQDAP